MSLENFVGYLNNNYLLSRLHSMRGILPGTRRDPKGRFTSNEAIPQQEGGIWENVSEHMGMALLVVDTLGQVLEEKGQLTRQERIEVNLAAWLHDTGKKTERMWQTTIESNPRIYKQDDIKGPVAAKKKAFRNIAELEEWENTEFGIPVKVSGLMRANIPQSENGHTSLAEKLMWFADGCLTGTKVKKISERFDDLETDTKNGRRNIKFSKSFSEIYGGKPLYEVQRSLANRYEKELENLLEIEDETIYEWLQRKIEKRMLSTESLHLMINEMAALIS